MRNSPNFVHSSFDWDKHRYIQYKKCQQNFRVTVATFLIVN